MVAITMLSVLFFIHAILLQPANSVALLKVAKEAPFKALCSTNCQDVGNTKDENGLPRYKCSCSPSCVKFKDCCYDSPYRKETTWERINSICVSIFDRGQYRLISGCPDGKTSNSCRDRMGHHPPVTSKTTNTSYANICFATCNGDGDSVITWNVVFKCSADKKDGTEVAADDSTVLVDRSSKIRNLSKSTSTRRSCKFHVQSDNFSVLDELELRPCDSEEKTSRCLLSWDDEEMIKLCRSYEDPVYFGSTLFRNSHCAQCNNMVIDPTFARCIQQMGPAKGRRYSFADLVNIHQVITIGECGPGETYDAIFSMRCRPTSS